MVTTVIFAKNVHRFYLFCEEQGISKREATRQKHIVWAKDIAALSRPGKYRILLADSVGALMEERSWVRTPWNEGVIASREVALEILLFLARHALFIDDWAEDSQHEEFVKQVEIANALDEYENGSEEESK